MCSYQTILNSGNMSDIASEVENFILQGCKKQTILSFN